MNRASSNTALIHYTFLFCRRTKFRSVTKVWHNVSRRKLTVRKKEHPPTLTSDKGWNYNNNFRPSPDLKTSFWMQSGLEVSFLLHQAGPIKNLMINEFEKETDWGPVRWSLIATHINIIRLLKF